ncbi:MAG: cupin domain-containing protein [Acidobacteria bacterium]|nr:MAG: cupin domain-containing protein [Acidobacteriota bacterium]
MRIRGRTILLTLCCAALVAQARPQSQSAVVTGNHDTPLRPVVGAGNSGVSNAVLRDQPEVRALRVAVEPGGTRVIHAHNDVKFHLFIPISGTMQLDLEGAQPVTVAPWHPYYMTAGTRHGFRNVGASPVEIMEVFIR